MIGRRRERLDACRAAILEAAPLLRSWARRGRRARRSLPGLHRPEAAHGDPDPVLQRLVAAVPADARGGDGPGPPRERLEDGPFRGAARIAGPAATEARRRRDLIHGRLRVASRKRKFGSSPWPRFVCPLLPLHPLNIDTPACISALTLLFTLHVLITGRHHAVSSFDLSPSAHLYTHITTVQCGLRALAQSLAREEAANGDTWRVVVDAWSICLLSIVSSRGLHQGRCLNGCWIPIWRLSVLPTLRSRRAFAFEVDIRPCEAQW